MNLKFFKIYKGSYTSLTREAESLWFEQLHVVSREHTPVGLTSVYAAYSPAVEWVPDFLEKVVGIKGSKGDGHRPKADNIWRFENLTTLQL